MKFGITYESEGKLWSYDFEAKDWQEAEKELRVFQLTHDNCELYEIVASMPYVWN